MLNEYVNLKWLVLCVGKTSVYAECSFRELESAIDFISWNMEEGNAKEGLLFIVEI